MPESGGTSLSQDPGRLYRLLVESVRDYAIFTLDPDGYIMSWNPGAERLKQYTAEEAIGRHFSMFYTEADRAEDKPKWKLLAAAAEGRVEDEGWRVRRDGTLFWANVVVTALFEEGRLVGFAKVTRDLTERREAELRAREDARRLAEVEAANRAKAEFLTALSHELRTPLNAIAGYVDLLAVGVHGPVNEEQLRDLERIRHSQKHLLGIINDMLNYSRIEAGRLTYDLQSVAVCQVVDGVLSLIRPQAEARGIALETEDPPAQPIARADAARLEQILLNLVFNAVKFSHAGGSARVLCGETGEHVFVTVVDQGIGIPEDQHEAIFEPFVQVGRSLTSSHEGTGLGLAISRDLARAMGGDITVQSAPGAGAAFTVWLPRGEG